MWVNSLTAITPVELAAVDLDSPPSSLTYQILPPHNGHIALAMAPNRPISNFTQANINNEEIVFVHRGMVTQFLLNYLFNCFYFLFMVQCVPLFFQLLGTSDAAWRRMNVKNCFRVFNHELIFECHSVQCSQLTDY